MIKKYEILKAKQAGMGKAYKKFVTGNNNPISFEEWQEKHRELQYLNSIEENENACLTVKQAEQQQKLIMLLN